MVIVRNGTEFLNAFMNSKLYNYIINTLLDWYLTEYDLDENNLSFEDVSEMCDEVKELVTHRPDELYGFDVPGFKYCYEFIDIFNQFKPQIATFCRANGYDLDRLIDICDLDITDIFMETDDSKAKIGFFIVTAVIYMIKDYILKTMGKPNEHLDDDDLELDESENKTEKSEDSKIKDNEILKTVKDEQ